VFKWIGLSSCLIVLLALAACTLWYVVIFRLRNNSIALAGGAFVLGPAEGVPWTIECQSAGPGTRLETWASLAFVPRSLPFMYTIPLWMPLGLVSLPTAILWHLDRRRPAPGACRCGYNLTGNVSGACPECGRALEVVA
jgi:hypothetical protein